MDMVTNAMIGASLKLCMLFAKLGGGRLMRYSMQIGGDNVTDCGMMVDGCSVHPPQYLRTGSRASVGSRRFVSVPGHQLRDRNMPLRC